MNKKEYEREMFEAYIATESQFEWYRKAFDFFDARDGKIGWYWNLWAALGGFWYFVYRKEMNVALWTLFVTIFVAMILPIGWYIFAIPIFMVLMGGFGTYFIYKQYIDKKQRLETVLKDEKKSIIVMKHQLGGVNLWSIYVAILFLVSLVLIMIGVYNMSGKS
ncbi:hypothetical protein MNB_SV-6-1319 [hydrothermal vent metagenome]|uniref:DUF2628 domain-containing protein n=1 Tax=hydrothermal vent metagenome TaxID=652676 RepID=A0A1W1BEK1_9ZZZZ